MTDPVTDPAPEALVVTEPGVYDDMPELVYHDDPVWSRSLSFSGAKRLMQSSPAHFRYEREHGRAPKAAFDVGTAAHKQVLGVGGEVVVVDAADWRTKAAQDRRKEAYAAGATPILIGDAVKVNAMASALLTHPAVRDLLEADAGKAERSVFWEDQMFGVWRRARIDFAREDGTLIDYKTTVDANPATLARKMADFGYHQQAPWYVDGAREVGLHEEPTFVFIFQEKEAPYLPSVVTLDAAAMREGRRLNDLALELYAECTVTDEWPGYPTDTTVLSLPPWAFRR